MVAKGLCWSILMVTCAAGASAAELPGGSKSQLVAEAPPNGACGQRMKEAHEHGRPVRVLLATLPDPIDTVYGREFDSIFESIVRAAGRSGYELERLCLSWAAEDPGRRHEREPSLVVLRAENGPSCRARECLLVLVLLGERPQEGVGQEVVHRALDTAAPLQPPGADVAILGPTFSASAESLARAIGSWRAEDGLPRSFRIRSGSTTEPRVRALLEATGKTVDFRSLAASHDDLQGCVWNRLVSDRLGLEVRWPDDDDHSLDGHPCAPEGDGSDNSRVALLVERSAYGRQFERGSFEVVHFTPHLPYLRAAYATLGNEGPDADTGHATGDHGSILPLRLGRSVAQRFPFFDRDGTIVTQDLVLRSTLQRLARLKVQVVGIVATNVMDKIFLADMVRDLVPNARLITFEGDILLSHPAVLPSTLGTLVASSNPLLPSAQRSAAGRELQNHFDFDAAQGAYRAAAELLSGRRDEDQALWLAVVGRGGLHPLARVALGTEASTSAGEEAAIAPPGSERRVPNGWLLLVVLATFGLAAILGIAAVELHLGRNLLLRVIPSDLLRPRLLASGANALQGLLTLLPLVLGLPYLILLIPLEAYRRADGGPAWTQALVELTLIVAACLLAILVLTFVYLTALLVARTFDHLVRSYREDEKRGRIGRALRALLPVTAVLLATVLAAHTADQWRKSTHFDGETALMTLERSLSLSNGVSPILPSLIIGLIVTGWIMLALYRQGCVVTLPRMSEIAGLDADTREPIRCLRESIEPVSFQIRRSWGWWLVLCLIPSLYISLFFLDLQSWPVRGIEGRRFEEATNLLLTVAVVLTIASGLSLLNGWRALRALLLRVDRLKASWPGLKDGLQEAYSAATDALAVAREEAEDRLAELQELVDPQTAPTLYGRLGDGLAVSWARVLAWMATNREDTQNQVHLAVRSFFTAAMGVLVRRMFLQLVHLRTFMTCALLGLLLALLSYPFEPERLLRLYASILVVAGVAVSATVLFQARKAASWNFILPQESRSEGFGDLTARLAFHAGLPALGLVASRFPHIGGPLLQWVEQLARPFS